MKGRSRAREVVMQLIFQTDFQSARSEVAESEFICNRLLDDEKLVEFAKSLINGVRENLETIDTQIGELATNWKFERMSATDRSILRLAVYEIMYSDTPGPVAINEAIELGKRFGSKESGKFINGILDQLVKRQNGNDKQAIPATED